ncbi:MAG: Ig-like domain-containing protein [Verrucomicrobia bacterium]|nr:Ig-like domain-containing protein [Verrucomicrobiota bacterium]
MNLRRLSPLLLLLCFKSELKCEIADAAYRDGVFFNINYHAALMAGYDNGADTYYVIHSAGGSSYEPNSVRLGTWSEFVAGNNFLGQTCPANFSKGLRDSILNDAFDQLNAHYWGYGPFTYCYARPNTFPSSGDGCFRCDFLVEWAYEQNGYDVCNDADLYLGGPSFQSGSMPNATQTLPINVTMTYPNSVSSSSPTITSSRVVVLRATASDTHSGLSFNKPFDYYFAMFENGSWGSWQFLESDWSTNSVSMISANTLVAVQVEAFDNDGNSQWSPVYYIKWVPETTPPTVSITNPPSAKTYTNSQTVTISATASDNIGVASVEFYDGATLQVSDATPAYTFDWSFTAADNGAHVWTTRAYDAAGNVSTSSAVTLTVSIDITPPTVVISSPASGANLTTSPTTVSGTASDPGSPTSGLNLVEVQVNGGGWQAASGTTSWSRSVTLTPCGNTIEARSLDKAGNYSTNALISVTYTPPNTVPNTPSNISPPNAATTVSVTPTLQANAFNDVDCIGDTHVASQWQVLNSAGAVVVADSGTDTVNKATWTVPTNKLYYGSNYVWKVRYQDSRSGWSSYSAQTTFATGGPLLSGAKQGTNMVFKWPTNALGFSLQWVTNLSSVNWSNATPAPLIVSGQYTVTNSMTNTAKFYRLKK